MGAIRRNLHRHFTLCEPTGTFNRREYRCRGGDLKFCHGDKRRTTREKYLRGGNLLDLEQGGWSTNEPIACLPSHDSHDAQNSHGGQEVKQYKGRGRGKSLLCSLRLLLQKENTNKITQRHTHTLTGVGRSTNSTSFKAPGRS